MEGRVNAAAASDDRKVLADLRAIAAAEAIQRKEAQEEQQRTLEELSRIGGLLNAAERRAAGLGKSVEEAEKREVGESKRLRELEVGLALFTLFCSQNTD